jgi:hypothetical protein
MVLKKVLLIMLLASPGFADTGFTSTLRVSEQDSAPACTVGQIKVTNGTLTCNGQIANITTGGGGGSGLTYLKDTSSDTVSSADLEFQSSNMGPVLVDSDSCKWRATITTAGNLVTSLLSCPTAPSTPVDTCTRGQPRGLLLSLTCPG